MLIFITTLKIGIFLTQCKGNAEMYTGGTYIFYNNFIHNTWDRGDEFNKI